LGGCGVTRCRLPFLVCAFADALRPIRRSALEEQGGGGGGLAQKYEAWLLEALEERVVGPLCTDVENDLRLHIHTKTLEHMSAVNPKRINRKCLRPLLDLAPLRVGGKRLNIRSRVSRAARRVSFYCHLVTAILINAGRGMTVLLGCVVLARR
jgi:WASH complex subunit 7